MSELTFDDKKERSEILGEYIIEKKSTVRAAAKAYGISKSTVHKDITEKLPHINSSLYKEVKKVLETNKKERHIRGGMATKHKYELMQKKN
ncbi:MAG: sporulation transcriptional regulator SpoIIID [Oscillospiraceae bacterium]|nr:sporulation transcriptional regulator SpoIIID [Oscillospiraceae bacterium]MDD7280044.1 sporulation transcriptional regulator SpoIIID [Oscillospiraceae bacterium]MDY2864949.1 sporulation transcriptional regulator SpoIIID [Oscillospiraceae bacterium]